MIVLKFGGTSVGDASRILAASRIVLARRERRPVVVVSALAGVTDQLLAGVDLALAGDTDGYRDLVVSLRERHGAVVSGLELPAEARAALERDIRDVLEELQRVYLGIALLGEATARSRDAVSVRGEGLSSRIVAACLESLGCPATWLDAADVMRTNAAHGQAVPDLPALEESCARLVVPAVLDGRVPVVGGFAGATTQGVPTTLGRGGSDHSATLIAVACGAEEVQIWTDVDGMMTADPRLAPKARVLASVPFDEAAELAYFGAKVLHPATIRPAIEAGIPVFVKNTMNPDAPGTEITRERGSVGALTAVAAKKDITLVTISSARMLMAHGVLARIFEAFDRHRTPVDLVATSEVSVSLTIDDASRLPAIVEDLSTHFTVEAAPRCAIVSLVGRGILSERGIAARLFSAVRGINVLMISVGASDINVSFVVREEDVRAAVTAVHAEFFEERAA